MKQPKTKAPAASATPPAGTDAKTKAVDPSAAETLGTYANHLQIELNDLGLQLANTRMTYVGTERRILAAMEIKSQQIVAARARIEQVARSAESPAVPS